MSSQGKKAQPRSGRARAQAAQRRWLLGGAVAVVLLLAAVFFLTNRTPEDEGFYRFVTPTDVADAIRTGDSVVVYFHSPT
ncbi:MAG TPA: hypothetical protein VIK93_09985 [Limnochordales bacterium]